jgi:hypothetical protein
MDSKPWDYSENWAKPRTIYALASGIYPIINRFDDNDGQRRGEHAPGIQYRYSKDYRSRPGSNPTLWYKGPTAVKPYIQGNYIFQSYKTNPMRFNIQSGWLEKYKDRLVGDIANRARPVVEQMNRDMGSAMNVQLKKSYNTRGGKPLGKVVSLEETSSRGQYELGAGEGRGRSQKYDFIDRTTGAAINVTKSSMLKSGHGIYGAGKQFLEQRFRDINSALKKNKIEEREAHQLKAMAGAEYFRQRTPEWNAHIRKIKKSLGRGVKLGTTKKKADLIRHEMRTQSKLGMTFPQLMYKGHRSLYFQSTGFMNEGGARMTKQLLGNPSVFFTRPGAFETWPIDAYTHAIIGPFIAHGSGPKFAEYKEISKIHGVVSYGIAKTVNFGKTAREQMIVESGLKTDMASFLQASHKGGSMTLANDSMRTITQSDMWTKHRLRPTVNLVQAGKAFNAKINELIEVIKFDGSRGKPPEIVRNIITKNRFKLRYGGERPLSVWAAPYISIFDSQSMLGTGK